MTKIDPDKGAMPLDFTVTISRNANINRDLDLLAHKLFTTFNSLMSITDF
jgi:hypothetical protein